MRHGYTNSTEVRGSTVWKVYAGPGAQERQYAEGLALSTLLGFVPVPEVVEEAPGRLVTRFVSGQHGQELVDDGYAGQVLEGCGQTLRALHAVDPAVVFGSVMRQGAVIVHGDYGPNNLLFESEGSAVTAVLDWEFCHAGEAIEDLAWCEWIIRAHHPRAMPELPQLFASYGWSPPWAARQAAMRQRCASLEQFCRDWDPTGDGVDLWIARGRQVDSWTEVLAI